MSNFQTVLIAVFLSFFVFAVLIFSGILPIGNSSSKTTLQGKVLVWGTLPSSSVSSYIQNMSASNNNLIIKYVQKSQDTYNSDLIESFAAGNNPDLFFITPDMVLKYKKFIYPIPYASYPEKIYRENFIDGADVFLNKEGILGFPIVSDPLVLYYNKDILSNSGVANPPHYWDELFNLNDLLTKKTNDGVLSQSMIAMGSFNNVDNAKDILSLLLLGSGNKIIDFNKESDHPRVVVNEKNAFSNSPLEQSLTFFNEFSNQKSQAYSWNSSLSNSRDMFTKGKLVLYIGHASELFRIREINPNINFDVTEILQTRDTDIRRTTGPIYAIAISNKSKNLPTSIGVASLFADQVNVKELSTALSIPPAQKSLLNENPSDPYLFTFYKSSVFLHSWLDPNTKSTDLIFRELIQNFNSNKLNSADSVAKFENQLNILINQ
ncbi:MAG: ABC transporter substrate-binding protein [Candidatus Nomurabacteria bacterium]|nr:ABC transporter substrate-binding protein [Candidatus Nomurabacteria bacterium]